MLGIVETVAGVVDNVLDKFIKDKDLKTKLNHELKKSVQDANLAQIQVNMEIIFIFPRMQKQMMD